MAKEMAKEMAKKMAKTMAPTLLVWGFKQHGKSSLIDSVMRCMYDEEENLVRRAGSRAPDMYSVLHVLDVDESGEDSDEDDESDEEVLFRLVDSPAVASEEESKSELARVLKQGVWHKMRMGEEETDDNLKRKHRLRPDCVVLVVSSRGCNMSELKALADIIHGTGTPFVVAVTHKDGMHLGNYLMQVADACRNESVFCFENYVQRPDDTELGDVEENYEANRVIAKLLIQAFEYIWEDRRNDRLYSNVTPNKGECVDDSHNSYPQANVRESFELL